MYATTSYIHPHVLSVCIKRRHRTQVFKMSETKLCVICNEGSTQPSKKLISSSEMITDLVKCCNERLSLGELEIKQLCDRLNSLSETEKSSVYYHSECRKTLVNKVNIERLRRTKRSSRESPSSSLHRPGRPSSSGETPRPKRAKIVPKSQICIFSPCEFCPKDNTEPLQRVESDSMDKH